MPQAPEIMNEYSSLMQIVKDLRGPDGCPWDKEQTHQSLAPFAIEEVFEMIDALESKNDANFKEELGDVLFQVALHCQLAQERGAFDYHDVIQTLTEKLVRRHPHVFSSTQVKDIDEVWANWEKIKKEEKLLKQTGAPKTFDFPSQLPALQRAHKIGVKSQKLKFDWQTPDDVFTKVLEELNELKEEIQKASLASNLEQKQSPIKNLNTPAPSTDSLNNLPRIQEEFGDLLFSLAQWARHLNFEPEQALRMANLKFETRFEKMMNLVAERKLDWTKLSDPEKEALWQEIKKK
jgi:tetrapyrrole methylase family protein/MazG family protein